MFKIFNALQGSEKKKEVISDLLSTKAPPPGLEPAPIAIGALINSTNLSKNPTNDSSATKQKQCE